MKKELNVKQNELKKILIVMELSSEYIDYAYNNGYTFIQYNDEYYLVYKIGKYIEIECIDINII